jgi:hypothetical protein
VLSKQESTIENTALYSPEGSLLATGYVRVITLKPAAARKHGGPYFEITDDQIQKQNLRLVTNVRHVFFHEYRSNDPAKVMVYLQRRPIAYADYRPGFWYIALSDVRQRRAA